MCYTRTPGSVQRQGYPESGGVMDQDAWVMKNLERVERAYLHYLSDMRQDREQAESLAQSHSYAAQAGSK